MKLLLSGLQQVVYLILKGSPECKENMLKWFSSVLALNDKRAGLQVDPETVSTDGFMINTALVLLKLCEPFIDPKSGKVGLQLVPKLYRIILPNPFRLALLTWII